MKSRDTSAGISLLETLVGLLVIAMIALVMSQGLSTSIRFLSRSAGTSVLVEQMLARRDLRNLLEHGLPALAPDDDRAIFTGSGDHLTFLSSPPNSQFWPGRAVEVSLQTGEPEAKLQGLDPSSKGEKEVILLLAPEEFSLSFSYWGKVADDGPSGWRKDWPVGQMPPDLVRIDFSGAEPAPPSMIVRVGKAWSQSEMSLSSLLPPSLPSRP